MDFYGELKKIVNKHGIDSRLNIPDEIVACYIMECLTSLERVSQAKSFYSEKETCCDK